MKTKTDFLFCLTNKAMAENLDRVCSGAGLSFVIVDDFDHLISAIEMQRFKYIFVDLDDATLKPLQILDWLGTFFLYSKIGIFVSKSYKNEFLQALKLGAGFFVTQEQYGRIEKLESELKSLVDSRGPVLPLLISGEKGTGKKNRAKELAQQAGYDEFVVFDAEKIPDFEQKKKFFEVSAALKGKKNACLCLHHISSLHAEIQEMIAEYLINKKLDVSGLEDFNACIMATTSKDLSSLAEQNSFREDLYFILKKSHTVIPPLRERNAEIPAMIEALLDNESRLCFFSRDAMLALIGYNWPGNDAELVSVVSSVLKSAKSAAISAKLLPQEILQKSYYRADPEVEEILDSDYNEAKKRVLHQFSHKYIAELIKNSDENLTVAAEKAGMDRSNFKKLMKKYGFE